MSDEWKPIRTAPMNATWVILKLRDGTEVRAHYAEDFSGEDQPAFCGWFREAGTHFVEVPSPPVGWKDEQK